jgi:hypothetical protein
MRNPHGRFLRRFPVRISGRRIFDRRFTGLFGRLFNRRLCRRWWWFRRIAGLPDRRSLRFIWRFIHRWFILKS